MKQRFPAATQLPSVVAPSRHAASTLATGALAHACPVAVVVGSSKSGMQPIDAIAMVAAPTRGIVERGMTGEEYTDGFARPGQEATMAR